MSSATPLDLSLCYEKLKAADPLTEFGIVEKIVGNSIESQGPNATVGSVCWLSNGEKQFPVEVVGFTGGKVITMPLGKVDGVRQGDLLRVSGRTASIGMSEALRGRILDGLGRPIDGKPLPAITEQQPLYAEPSNPMDRDPIRETIQTGVRSIDGLLTCGMGQRIGIFGGSGVGKSTLLGMIAKYTSADINVIALVGERGREVREFIENDLGESGLERSVVFVSTSDQPALVRIRAAFAATAAAEYFRDRGYNVMLMMDSVTRFAMAQREVGLAAGEPPSSKGYTPSVFSLLPRLLERSGKFPKGSITAFYTVLVEGDDMSDPVADSVRSILDGHIVLDRKLAGRGQYPCIDILASISRLMPQLVDETVTKAAYSVRDLLAVHRDSEDLINIGAYKRGSNPRIDRAIEKIDSINGFLKQRAEEPSTLNDTRESLLSLVQ
ncbi:MAG TPA: FliI/YscN family ATPase [Terriglobia bacterium]|nr:FliI/YscN family ATPase [Terriglobia bacterium]